MDECLLGDGLLASSLLHQPRKRRGIPADETSSAGLGDTPKVDHVRDSTITIHLVKVMELSQRSSSYTPGVRRVLQVLYYGRSWTAKITQQKIRAKVMRHFFLSNT